MKPKRSTLPALSTLKAAPLKALLDLTQEEHSGLIASGKLWEAYSEATGDYRRDCVMTLSRLQESLNRLYPNHEAANTVYSNFYFKALLAEGLNEATARLVESEAYERGHSAGVCEIVSLSFELVEFAKAIIAANK